ncbi:MAG: Cys-tRNA(Pro) deacylase, partial [Clostridia bacterium]|nr:Cys-tRNA(Pro) deacylase [Clostridia bacterium]
MAAKGDEKTNVMRLLDGRKIPYEARSYEPDPTMSGEEIARLLNEDPEKVYKTLVTEGKPGRHYVFVIPVGQELDLKKAAKAAAEKSVAMIR